MAIVTAEKIVATADVTTFVNNMKSYVAGKINYDYNSPPHFSGTSSFNPSYSNATSYTGQNNPVAIPIGDLARNNIGSLGISNPNKEEQISGQTVFNVLISLVRTMTAVKKFNSTWHNKTNSTTVIVNTVSGTAVFNSSLPGVTPYSEVGSSNCAGWTRNYNSAVDNISTGNVFTRDSVIDDAKANTFFDALKAEWDNLYNSKVMDYHLYTCHYNCHSNCHSSGRHRR